MGDFYRHYTPATIGHPLVNCSAGMFHPTAPHRVGSPLPCGWSMLCCIGAGLCAAAAPPPATLPTVELEGRVTFATVTAKGLSLEMRSTASCIWVDIPAPDTPQADPLLGKTVRVRGVRDPSSPARLRVARLADIEMVSPITDDAGITVLTEARQIINLSADDASHRLPVHVRGTATFVFKGKGLCMQDASGAVWVRCENTALPSGQPQLGDELDVVGSTMADPFASRLAAAEIQILGRGNFPEPARPTWDALLSRNLAHTWVEMDGVFGPARYTGDRLQMSLSRSEGLVPVQCLGPKPSPDELARLKSFENGVVRIRGCVVPNTTLSTSDVRGSLIYVPDLSWVGLVEPPPIDLFALAATPVANLFRYDPRATPVQRLKIAGTLLWADGDESVLDDTTGGIRLFKDGGVRAAPGDRLEAVGFVDLGEGYPVLRAPEPTA